MLATANTHSVSVFQKHLGLFLLLVIDYLATFSREKPRVKAVEACGFPLSLIPCKRGHLVLMGIQGKRLAAWLVLTDEESVIPYLDSS